MNLPTFHRQTALSLLEKSELALIQDKALQMQAQINRSNERLEKLHQAMASYVSLTQKLTEEITQYKRNCRPR